MYDNQSAIGNIGEAVAVAEFTKRKIPVLIPFGQNLPYDLVIDFGGKLRKVQCKTANEVKDDGSVMRFYIYRTNGFTGEHKKYQKDEVDLFFIYCVENGFMGLARRDKQPGSEIRVRMSPPKNNVKKGVHMYYEYNIDNVLQQLLEDAALV